MRARLFFVVWAFCAVFSGFGLFLTLVSFFRCNFVPINFVHHFQDKESFVNSLICRVEHIILFRINIL